MNNKSIYKVSYLAAKHRSWKIRKRNRKRMLELADKFKKRNQIEESFNIVNKYIEYFQPLAEMINFVLK